MTEVEWLACGDPDVMLAFLDESHRESQRKDRLFIAACCRLVWHKLEGRERAAAELNERLADGFEPHQPVAVLIHPMLWRSAEPAAQADILRDLYGSLFRACNIEFASLTPIIKALAQAAGGERILPSGQLDLARLAVLADALEEAGCTDAAILDHLPGPHVRGCWAVDALLGKK
jgi:hypothetical protein